MVVMIFYIFLISKQSLWFAADKVRYIRVPLIARRS